MLGGLAATRFVRKGPNTQHRRCHRAVRTACYTLQLTTGTAIRIGQALTALQAVQSTDRLSS